MIDPGLNGKVVLITGANNPLGIGAATARAFAEQGASVFLHYYRPAAERLEGASADAPFPGERFYRAQQQKTPDAVIREIRALGVPAAAWEADLGCSENVPLLLDRVEERLGPADVLINNAAHCAPDSFRPLSEATGGDHRTLSPEGVVRHFAVNTQAVALLMAEFARRFVRRGAADGRIVNVSTDGASCFPGEVSYGASKHAMESYSRSAAVELGPYGITVNVVAPGPVQTGYITPELEERLIPDIPLRRIGTAEEVADAIVFLASHQARWITGQLLYVGGGHVIPL